MLEEVLTAALRRLAIHVILAVTRADGPDLAFTKWGEFTLDQTFGAEARRFIRNVW